MLYLSISHAYTSAEHKGVKGKSARMWATDCTGCVYVTSRGRDALTWNIALRRQVSRRHACCLSTAATAASGT